jgi:DnaJ-domain-containing protein 1
MPRALMRHSIVELEKLFSSSQGDVGTLQSLADELKHRNVPRAVALLEKVQRTLPSPVSSMSAASSSVFKAAAPAPAQGALWSDEPKPARKTRPTTPGGPAKAPASPLAVRPTNAPALLTIAAKPAEAALPMSAEEAYKVLKATPGTSWEEIEQTRRQLVQQAHPDRVVELSPERRVQAQQDAKRANSAYTVLIEKRML